MPGIAELATVMMVAAQRRMAVTANNLSNLSTPSFRAQRVFSQVADLRRPVPMDAISVSRTDGARTVSFTGNAFDIAVTGSDAVLLLRSGEAYRAVSSVQLRRDVQGRLVDPAGRPLQAAGGGDLVLGVGVPSILADGTILVGGQAVGRVGLFSSRASGPGTLAELPPPADESVVVRQGYLTPAEVDPATEMVELTKAARLAETGARIFQLSDELLGQAASKLGDLR